VNGSVHLSGRDGRTTFISKLGQSPLVPLLGPGERILFSEETESGSGRDGILVLSSHRLIFEGRLQQGFIREAVRGKKVATLMDLQLAQLSNVHRDKPLIGRASLRVEALGKSHVFRVRDADAWVSAISPARQYAPTPGAPGAPVIVNVNTVAAPQQPVQAFLHCRFCGALMPAGSAGPGMRCSSCGAAL
jgi:hypothetical protein